MTVHCGMGEEEEQQLFRSSIKYYKLMQQTLILFQLIVFVNTYENK